MFPSGKTTFILALFVLVACSGSDQNASTGGLTSVAVAADEPAQAPTQDAAKPTSPTQTGEVVPLEIKLPDAKFVGTPRDIRTPNLERVTGKSRPPFLAPADAVNLAKGKPVTSSADEPIIGFYDQITDGDKDASQGSYVEMAPGKQWIQIDLGQTSELYAIVAWHYHAQGRAYFDVVVRVSDDPDFLKYKEVFNNDHDNSSGMGIGKDKDYIETNEGRLIDTKRARARYLRLYSNGNTSDDLNHYIEVEAYGKPLGGEQ